MKVFDDLQYNNDIQDDFDFLIGNPNINGLQKTKLLDLKNKTQSILPVPPAGMDNLGLSSPFNNFATYQDADYLYVVNHGFTPANSIAGVIEWQVRMSRTTGLREVRTLFKPANTPPSGASWTNWQNIDDLKANQIQQSRDRWRVNDIDSVEEQAGVFAVGEEFDIYLDEEYAILRVSEVDENGAIVAFTVSEAGKSNYDFTGDWFEFYTDGNRYFYVSLIAEYFEETYAIDLPEAYDQLQALDIYLRSNFYTKASADTAFLKKNTMSNITKYATENQLQNRINEIQKWLLNSNSASLPNVIIYVQDNQSGNIYIDGFTGASFLKIIVQGNYTITGNVYVRNCLCTVEFSYYNNAAQILSITGTLEVINCPRIILRNLSANIINLLHSSANFGGSTAVSAHIVAEMSSCFFRNSGYSVPLLSIQASVAVINSSVPTTELTNLQVNPAAGLVIDNRAGNPLEIYRRKANEQKFISELNANEEVNIRVNIYAQRFQGYFSGTYNEDVIALLISAGTTGIIRAEGMIGGVAFAGGYSKIGYATQNSDYAQLMWGYQSGEVYLVGTKEYEQDWSYDFVVYYTK